jgi:hypothetical protein
MVTVAEIQRSFLPPAVPTPAAHEIAVHYAAAERGRRDRSGAF